MATITGSGTLVAAAATIGRGPPSNTHLGVARALLPAAEHLAHTMENSAWPTAFISGQITECLLRALLSQGGAKDPAKGKKDLQHNLINLWNEAKALFPGLSVDPPKWIGDLNTLHSTYQLRYGNQFDFTVIPNAKRLVGEVRSLLLDVESLLIDGQNVA